jgi:hypothetical protein
MAKKSWFEIKSRKPIFTKGPRELQAPKESSGLPVGWGGSMSEWIVYRNLGELGYREGTDYTYQSRESITGGLPGRLEIGGLIADFLFEDLRLIINPVSEFYHYRRDVVGQELSNRAALERQGYHVVYIDSDALERDPKFYVREALVGRDYSRLANGFF